MRSTAVILIEVAVSAQLGGCTGTLHLGTQTSGFTTR